MRPLLLALAALLLPSCTYDYGVVRYHAPPPSDDSGAAPAAPVDAGHARDGGPDTGATRSSTQ